MKPLSNDLRRRIIDRIQTNEESQPEIAEHFAVSLSFVEKLWFRFRSTGKFEALPHAGGRERSLKDEESFLRQQVAEQPDVTLVELAERIAAQTGKPRVSATTLSQELRRLNLPRKKRSFTPVNGKLSAFKSDEPNIKRRWRRKLLGS